MKVSDTRLLGQLAQLSWFSANGEVAATRSLGFMLELPPLRDAIFGFLTDHTGVDLTPIQRIVTESVNPDGNRPDLEGRDVAGRPLLVLEAKFAARMSNAQVTGYLADQTRRLAEPDGAPGLGLLVLLVPEAREAEARSRAETARAAHPEGATTLVLTWGRWLEVWQAAADAAGPDAAGLRSDVEQFGAMCHTLGGMVVPAFADAAPGEGGAWRSRLNDYAQIVDQVTASLAPPGYPIGNEKGAGGLTHRRYFRCGYRNDQGNLIGWATVGLQHRLGDAGESPIWWRANHTTPGFTHIRDRIVASPYRTVARSDGGHLWLPLVVDSELPGPELVADLLKQVRRIEAVISEPAALENSGLDHDGR